MDVASNLENVLGKIRKAEEKYQRPLNSVQLLAVSKTHSDALVRQAYHAGQRAFGESYVQEALEKQEKLSDCEIDWHFVGSIQSNKTRAIAERFNWVHSINRFKIAKRLNEQRPAHLPPLNVFIEVNVSHEATKTGANPDEILPLLIELSTLKKLKVRGLMVIPQFKASFEQQKAIFDRVVSLQECLVDKGFDLDTLSMGMSHDFEAAIAAGSNLVRLGTAIFT